MPHRVDRTVEARALLPGDVIRHAEAMGATVLPAGVVDRRVIDKVKLAHVKLEGDDKVFTVPRLMLIDIVREVPTPEEEAADRRAYQLRSVELSIADVDADLAEARVKLLEALPYRSGYHPHYYENYISVQVLHTLWNDVAKTAAGIAERDGEPEDLIAATRLIRDKMIKDLLDARHASRSTSGMHNAAEDVERDTKVSWLRRLSYTLTD